MNDLTGAKVLKGERILFNAFKDKYFTSTVARPGGLGGLNPPPHLPSGQLLGFVQNRRDIFLGGVRVPQYLASAYLKS
jgi:hypothetical protein